MALRRPRLIPFVVVAPAAVLTLGAAVVVAILVLGLGQLRLEATRAAERQSQLLATALAARLDTSPGDQHRDLVSRAAQRSSSFIVMLDHSGRVQFVAPEPSAAIVRAALSASAYSQPIVEVEGKPRGRASKKTRDGRVVVLSPSPDIALARSSLLTSLATFAGLLLAAAGFVAWALARDVHADVLYLRKLIVAMADDEQSPTAAPIPVRTIDQVGQLTASFNVLLERFRAAERAYRQDLDQARAFDEDRSAFLAALSHELRTPLNAILGFTGVLLNEIDGPLSEESRENLTVVRTSGEHLRALIDDILALSALESGQFRLSRENLDLMTVASEVVTEVRVTAEQKGLRISLQGDDSSGALIAFADRRRLRQVYQNVISNAVKFTREGRVDINLFRDGTDVVTVVSDTGPGIAEEALEGIFNEFEQAGTGSSQRQGTGLGLSITRRLVQMHGGSVRVQSSLGEGAMFMIRIPTQDPTRGTLPDLIPSQQQPLIREA